jgi:hypothetical protein
MFNFKCTGYCRICRLHFSHVPLVSNCIQFYTFICGRRRYFLYATLSFHSKGVHLWLLQRCRWDDVSLPLLNDKTVDTLTILSLGNSDPFFITLRDGELQTVRRIKLLCHPHDPFTEKRSFHIRLKMSHLQKKCNLIHCFTRERIQGYNVTKLIN